MRSFAVVVVLLLSAGCSGSSLSDDAGHDAGAIAFDAGGDAGKPDGGDDVDGGQDLDAGDSDAGGSPIDGGNAPDAGPTGGGMCDVPAEGCPPECIRAVSCVIECGGPVTECGCCSCAEGSIDTITCGVDG